MAAEAGAGDIKTSIEATAFLRAPFSRRNHRWLTAEIRIPATFGRRDESVTTSQ
jgi:hypothetical protein